MKTPLMKLIEWMKFETLPLPIPDTLILAKATELLEKEKELARHAFLNAINMGDDISPKTANELFEDYYTKTFTNESK